MANVTIKPRTGKNLFDYMVRALISTKEANNWALEEFVLIDGEQLDIQKIARLSDKAYLMLTNKVFAMDAPASGIQENNIEITYKKVRIKKKKLSRDFVTEMQTFQQTKKRDTVTLLKYCITKFYDVSLEELEGLPYIVTSHLINNINFFLNSLSDTRDDFELDDIWSEDAQLPTP